MSPVFTTTILSASWKPSSGRDQMNKDQLDSAKKDQLERWWWWWYSVINDGVLLTEYLPRGTTINGLYYASMIERLRSVIVEKGRGKVSGGVVLLHDNALIHIFKLLFDRLISSNWMIVPILCILHRLIPIHCQTLNKFVRSKNFSSNDEAATTVEDYFTDLNSEFFLFRPTKFAWPVQACEAQ